MEAACQVDEYQGSCLDEFLSKLQTFHLEFDAYCPLARLPRCFVREFGHLVASCVILRDPNLNEFEVRVLKKHDGLYFEDGWFQLRRFYNIWFGGWVSLTYINPKLMSIAVLTRWGSEVKYPLSVPPLKRLLVNGSDAFEVGSSASDTSFNPRLYPKCFARSYFKELTAYNFDVDTNGEFCCKVYGRWVDFCNDHRIKEGQKVRFAVTQPTSNYVLYVCVYPQIGLQTTLSYPLSDGTHVPLYVSQQYFVADY
ncbi:hypothetical protein TSUD_163450 [Trifolium subterraneum]|uniref:TF-B3 domain-containing protein n=1 Tax=Trifolium subterraneum TaxID=3900 RepID=A0A2Z6MZ85_TRISU|nr:hypothetical protein TSUD_163450 [Trifolium subterraneum]